MPGGLHTRLCHVFLVFFSGQLTSQVILEITELMLTKFSQLGDI